jgi:hypothetical protein
LAKNPPTGDDHRKGAVRDRSQFQTPSGNWAKRDKDTGRIMDVKTSDKAPFKGVRKEK